MRTPNRIFSLAFAVAATVAALAAPASASANTVAESAHLTSAGTTYFTAYSRDFIPCQARRICLYSAPNFRGMQVSWRAGDYHPNFDNIGCAAGWCQSEDDFNDEASSWANNSTGLRYCISEEAGGGGWDNSMPNLTQGNFGAGYDGKASSLSFQGCP